MAKKQNKQFVEWLDARIAFKEKQTMDHNGTVPHDFDQLCRYHMVRQYYDETKEAK